MSHRNLIDSVRNYLASNNMFVVEEWLTGFVEYLMEDNNSHNICEIQKLAKEQWLLNNLKDICPGSLPSNIINQHKCTLNEKYVLQINATVDIGTPAYQQYQKIKKVNVENVEATTTSEEKIPNHRMIKLYMTDGVQDICGIEYEPMRNLCCDITPGCKVLIKGPVECRRGIILLTEASVELLGGEVQEIVESNSIAALLSKKLGLPMIQDADIPTTENTERSTGVPTPQTQMSSRTNGLGTAGEPTTRPVARVTSVQVANFADDDIDFDQLAAIEAQYTDNPGKRTMADENTKPEKKLKMNDVQTINRAEDYPTENDFFSDDEEYLREIESNFIGREKHSSKSNALQNNFTPEPFVYIKQIRDLDRGKIVGRVFKIKGQIMKLLSKLSVGKDGWSLRCTLVDGSGCIDVDFTSDVLSELVGFTPQEMTQLKKQMASNPALKEKAVNALQDAKDKLQVLYCIIELTMSESPKITKLIPFEECHARSLERRVRES